MLCLTRRVHEEIVIRTPEGREIVVQVIDIDRNKVNLGFVAERDIDIQRTERNDWKRKEPECQPASR